ncbi:response regulator [Myxosarcina sp. GI1(2024)]
MTPQSTSKPKLIDNFIASKQLELFKELKEKCFSGEVVFSDRRNITWHFHLYLGRIVYTTGGEHPVRRWRRNLAYYFPQIVANLKSELELLQTIATEKIILSWDYYLLSLWIERQKIDREQANKMIRAVAAEVLFDITHAKNVDYYLIPQERASFKPLAMVDCEQQIIEAWKLWQQWEETKFAAYSPNLAPLIKQSQALQKKVNASESTYQILTKLLKGKYTFRDLAVQKQTSLLLVARSLTPYYRLGCIELVSIPDLPNTLPTSATELAIPTVLRTLTDSTNARLNSTNFSSLALRDNHQLKIACIDSNSMVCQIMKKIITSASYLYISDSGSLNTSAVLQESLPDIIFINIELAEFSGYDLCSWLRETDVFSHTPIILYSKTIGSGDWVKAKRAGCSQLIDEYLEAKLILNTIANYINTAS